MNKEKQLLKLLFVHGLQNNYESVSKNITEKVYEYFCPSVFIKLSHLDSHYFN